MNKTLKCLKKIILFKQIANINCTNLGLCDIKTNNTNTRPSNIDIKNSNINTNNNNIIIKTTNKKEDCFLSKDDLKNNIKNKENLELVEFLNNQENYEKNIKKIFDENLKFNNNMDKEVNNFFLKGDNIEKGFEFTKKITEDSFIIKNILERLCFKPEGKFNFEDKKNELYSKIKTFLKANINNDSKKHIKQKPTLKEFIKDFFLICTDYNSKGYKKEYFNNLREPFINLFEIISDEELKIEDFKENISKISEKLFGETDYLFKDNTCDIQQDIKSVDPSMVIIRELLIFCVLSENLKLNKEKAKFHDSNRKIFDTLLNNINMPISSENINIILNCFKGNYEDAFNSTLFFFDFIQNYLLNSNEKDCTVFKFINILNSNILSHYLDSNILKTLTSEKMYTYFDTLSSILFSSNNKVKIIHTVENDFFMIFVNDKNSKELYFIFKFNDLIESTYAMLKLDFKKKKYFLKHFIENDSKDNYDKNKKVKKNDEIINENEIYEISNSNDNNYKIEAISIEGAVNCTPCLVFYINGEKYIIPIFFILNPYGKKEFKIPGQEDKYKKKYHIAQKGLNGNKSKFEFKSRPLNNFINNYFGYNIEKKCIQFIKSYKFLKKKSPYAQFFFENNKENNELFLKDFYFYLRNQNDENKSIVNFSFQYKPAKHIFFYSNPANITNPTIAVSVACRKNFYKCPLVSVLYDTRYLLKLKKDENFIKLDNLTQEKDIHNAVSKSIKNIIEDHYETKFDSLVPSVCFNLFSGKFITWFDNLYLQYPEIFKGIISKNICKFFNTTIFDKTFHEFNKKVLLQFYGNLYNKNFTNEKFLKIIKESFYFSNNKEMLLKYVNYYSSVYCSNNNIILNNEINEQDFPLSKEFDINEETENNNEKLFIISEKDIKKQEEAKKFFRNNNKKEKEDKNKVNIKKNGVNIKKNEVKTRELILNIDFGSGRKYDIKRYINENDFCKYREQPREIVIDKFLRNLKVKDFEKISDILYTKSYDNSKADYDSFKLEFEYFLIDFAYLIDVSESDKRGEKILNSIYYHNSFGGKPRVFYYIENDTLHIYHQLAHTEDKKNSK